MKIMAVCGHGLGSSFMMEMNIKKALANLGVEAEVEHTDLASVNENDADIFIMARDIAKKVEDEMDYPGQIKVNIIRETRVVDYAK